MKKTKDIRLNTIIEAAVNEFTEKGYENASMESIALRAGLSKGGLYHYFGSKAEVLYSVNLKFFEPVEDLLSQIEKSDSFPRGLSGFITGYLTYWNDHRKELLLYFQTANESFRNQMIFDLYRESAVRLFSYFGQLFKEGRERGVFAEHNSYLHAVSLMSCLDGFLGYMLIDPSLEVNEVAEEIDKIYIKGILIKA